MERIWRKVREKETLKNKQIKWLKKKKVRENNEGKREKQGKGVRVIKRKRKGYGIMKGGRELKKDKSRK